MDSYGASSRRYSCKRWASASLKLGNVLTLCFCLCLDAKKRATICWHNKCVMSDIHTVLFQQADQARTDFAAIKIRA